MTTLETIAAIRKRHNDDVQRGAVYWADCLQDRQNLLNALEAAVKCLEQYAKWGKWSINTEDGEINPHPKITTAGHTLQQIEEMLK